jgi:hypothetical protein
MRYALACSEYRTAEVSSGIRHAFRNPQSAIRNPQSAIRNPQSAIRIISA